MTDIKLGNLHDLTEVRMDNLVKDAIQAGYTEYYNDPLCVAFSKPKTNRIVYISKISGDVVGLQSERA